MITPVEIQDKTFKSGFGYDKKDVNNFFRVLLEDYEELYKSNGTLKEKVDSLEEKTNYYNSLESSLQKALVLAEQSADNTKQSATKEADAIIAKANAEANTIIRDSKNEAESMIKAAKDEVEDIKKQSKALLQQYAVYKAQFKQLTNAQLELIENDAFQIQKDSFSCLLETEETLDEIEKEKTETNNLNEDEEKEDNNLNKDE